MKYIKKPIIVEAEQWFKVKYDHYPTSKDKSVVYHNSVGYYRNPYDIGKRKCGICKKTMNKHGYIDTLEGGHIVCPSDFIITGVNGEKYPCKKSIFYKSYEKVK